MIKFFIIFIIAILASEGRGQITFPGEKKEPVSPQTDSANKATHADVKAQTNEDQKDPNSPQTRFFGSFGQGFGQPVGFGGNGGIVPVGVGGVVPGSFGGNGGIVPVGVGGAVPGISFGGNVPGGFGGSVLGSFGGNVPGGFGGRIPCSSRCLTDPRFASHPCCQFNGVNGFNGANGFHGVHGGNRFNGGVGFNGFNGGFVTPGIGFPTTGIAPGQTHGIFPGGTNIPIHPGFVQPIGPTGFFPGGNPTRGFCPPPGLFSGLFGQRSLGNDEPKKDVLGLSSRSADPADKPKDRVKRQGVNEKAAAIQSDSGPQTRFFGLCRNRCATDFDCPFGQKCCLNLSKCRYCTIPEF